MEYCEITLKKFFNVLPEASIMKFILRKTWISSLVYLVLIDHIKGLNQGELDELASSLQIRVKVLDNLRNDGNRHIVQTTLKNIGQSPIPDVGWTLYFHSMLLAFPDSFQHEHNKTVDMDIEKVQFGVVQGDLYYMKPILGFAPISPGKERVYNIIVQLWAVSKTDFMPLWYVSSDTEGVTPRVVKSTSSFDLDYVEDFGDIKQWKRSRADRYNPYSPQDQMFKVDSSVSDGRNLIKLIKNATLPGQAYLLQIEAENQNIVLQSSTPQGMFYAVQSLRAIIDDTNRVNIPSMTLEDAPRYEWRGMHLDVARNFHSLEDVKRLIKAMAMYKMNLLHLHLTDDEGWRIEIPGLPELTKIGSRRCHDLNETQCIIPQFGSGPFADSSGTGYYTTAEYKDLLRFAKKHFITVVPEFDTPGHCHAAVVSMECRYNKFKMTGDDTSANEYRLVDPEDVSFYRSVQNWRDNAINPCINSTYKFIAKIIDEIKSMHQDIQPLVTYHFGGDEVAKEAWTHSPMCQKFLTSNPKYNVTHGLKNYFVTRVAEIAAAKNVKLGGWDDGFLNGQSSPEPIPISEFSNAELFVNTWNNIWEWGGGSNAYKFANAGFKVILTQATNLYFDHPQEPDPEERGLYWATRFTDTKKVFRFMPESLYDNIFEDKSGGPLSKVEICGEDMSKCTLLEKPENVIGIFVCVIDTSTFVLFVLGMQGALWSETVRTSQNMDYMIYPRLLALAERSWHKASFEDQSDNIEVFENEWISFSEALGLREFKRLDDLGISFRVPPPGARYTPCIQLAIGKWRNASLNHISWTRGHVNGGLFYIEPTPGSFPGIPAMQSLNPCTYNNKWWMVSRTDNMPNWFVTAPGMKAMKLKATESETLSYVGKFDTAAKWKRTREDRFDPYTAPERYDILRRNPSSKPVYRVVPTPMMSTFSKHETIHVDHLFVVVESQEFKRESQFLAETLKVNNVTTALDSSKQIKFEMKQNLGGSDAYEIKISPETHTVVIQAQEAPGAFYGAQTLISLVEDNDGNIPKATIRDAPRFGYRGVMLDVARNFKPKNWMLKFIDVMATYKLNKLHLHLSDDEAWRIEIPDIPGLTQIASKRCHSEYSDECVMPQLGSGPDTDTIGSGFYTVDDYREILDYANARHIEVIPEIDMPGHSAAAITVMEKREDEIDFMESHVYGPLPESWLLYDHKFTPSVYSVQKWLKNAMNPCMNSTYRYCIRIFLIKKVFQHGTESTRKFVERVVDGLKELHRPVQPLRIFHMGGDEVAHGAWSESRECFDNVEFRGKEIISDKGLNLGVWEDGVYADDKPNPITDFKSDVFVYPWNNRWGTNKAKRSSEFADAGYKKFKNLNCTSKPLNTKLSQVILPLATHLYFDMPQEPDPESRGLYWATRFIDAHKVFGLMPDNIFANVDVDRMGNSVSLEDLCGNAACPQPNKTENIIGLQACMWAEVMRTEEQFHNMAFPRLLALAERAWHRANWEEIEDRNARDAYRSSDWEAFADVLGYKELPRLEKKQVFYLVEPPGAR
ncbi:HEX-like protein [Mya arenaria]|uniref:beta-N-acetylhexosaminidase n=1 Tax=Mya arenaria TaxID=6604 RepID=A0ABY7DF92_MYAAR|nr:HEX-like protein [Mya arenaria]